MRQPSSRYGSTSMMQKIFGKPAPNDVTWGGESAVAPGVRALPWQEFLEAL